MRLKETSEYMTRCVSRFQDALSQPDVKLYIHIYPLNKYEDNYQDFHTWIQTQSENINGIVFLLQQGSFPSIESIVHKPTLRSYKVTTNPHFIDAGEIFMGTHKDEFNFIITKIREYIEEINHHMS